jgi:hypothetical protein
MLENGSGCHQRLVLAAILPLLLSLHNIMFPMVENNAIFDNGSVPSTPFLSPSHNLMQAKWLRFGMWQK